MAYIQKRKSAGGETRYSVRWRVNGEERQRTFRRSADANTFRVEVERHELSGVAFDPKRAELTFAVYADGWLAHRHKVDGRPLAARTKELYRYELDRFIFPTFGRLELGEIRVGQVRQWHGQLADSVSALQAAKAYRLLRVILNTAVEDERLVSNPCKVRGAGVERSPERPFVDADVVLAISEAIEDRYRAMVLLAGFGGLRLGELLGLRRCDVSVESGRVQVELQTVELKSGERLVTAPKIDAGRRVVAIPATVTEALETHLSLYTEAGLVSPVFTGPASEGLRRATFYTAWVKALAATGQRGIHLHDLCHAAGTLAAQLGATERELMARLGHASPVAARRYQHAAERRDTVIADALQVVIEAAGTASKRSQADPAIFPLRDDCGMTADTKPRKLSLGDPKIALPPGLSSRASDGNRTRVLSLGS